MGSRDASFASKAPVLAQQPALPAAHGPGRNGGKLAAQIGVAKRLAGDAQRAQTSENGPKAGFGFDATEDEMRMLVTW